jgi:hypothetical protein
LSRNKVNAIGSRYFTAVANAPISMVKPPSDERDRLPTGVGDLRAIAYGSPGAMVARFPEQEQLAAFDASAGLPAHPPPLDP